jgi:hypothetical protein
VEGQSPGYKQTRYIDAARTTLKTASIIVETCYHAIAYQTVSARIIVASCLQLCCLALDALLLRRNCGNVFTEPLSGNGHIRHNIIAPKNSIEKLESQ